MRKGVQGLRPLQRSSDAISSSFKRLFSFFKIVRARARAVFSAGPSARDFSSPFTPHFPIADAEFWAPLTVFSSAIALLWRESA